MSPARPYRVSRIAFRGFVAGLGISGASLASPRWVFFSIGISRYFSSEELVPLRKCKGYIWPAVVWDLNACMNE